MNRPWLEIFRNEHAVVFGLCIAIAVTLFVIPVSSEKVEGAWNIVWSDEFEGTSVDRSKWTYDVGDHWYNNELQSYTDRSVNSRVEGGNLVIEARREDYGGNQYTSARLKTQGLHSWQYGKLEARMKLPYGQGIWPAFWTLGNSGGWPSCGEIDIMEMIGGDAAGRDDTHYAALHWDDGGHQSASSHTSVDGKLADDYHIYGIEWDSSQIKWFLDGNQFFNVAITSGAMSEFHQPHFFILNIAVGGDWPGNPDGTTVFPQYMYVDWVRVYEWGDDPPDTEPPAAFDLLSPIDGLTTADNTPTLTWEESIDSESGLDHYEVWINDAYVGEVSGSSGTNNLARGETATSSSDESSQYSASNAVDGNSTSRWSSQFSDPQWIYVDLGSVKDIDRVVLKWESAYATTYKISVSNDATNWSEVYPTASGNGGTDTIEGLGANGRYVMMHGTARATQYGYSLYEFEIYGPEITGNPYWNCPSELAPGDYTWHIVAVDGFGNERQSTSAWTFTTPGAPDETPPDAFDLLAPLNSSSVGSETSLVWEASIDAESGLDHYEVWINDAYIAETAEPNYGASSMSPGSYAWYIVAVNSDGLSTQSTSTFSFTVIPDWQPTLGDVDRNGTINIVDALQTARYDAGMTPAPFEVAAGDVLGCDGIVNIIDALTIARYDAGMISSFDCD